jgi:hypothetical protein
VVATERLHNNCHPVVDSDKCPGSGTLTDAAPLQPSAGNQVLTVPIEDRRTGTLLLVL